MGLQESPASFAHLIDYCMRGLQGVLTYIVDLLCHARSHEEHLQVLEKIWLEIEHFKISIWCSLSYLPWIHD